uniref:Uncharacterized protein n=1 Tax=Balaenoptera musculus TaxID=9771 RepID=A0A8C0DFQ1_BALMU
VAGTPEPDPPVDPGGDERPTWGNKLQNLLSCVGFATYGGGSFLIPYPIAWPSRAARSSPSSASGQRLHRASIGVWTAISPYLGAVGLCGFIPSVLVSTHCDTVLARVLWRLPNSSQPAAPERLPAGPQPRGHRECRDSGAVSYFWYRQTLNTTADINDSGSVQWRLLVCLMASWATVYLCVIRDIEPTGTVRDPSPLPSLLASGVQRLGEEGRNTSTVTCPQRTDAFVTTRSSSSAWRESAPSPL